MKQNPYRTGQAARDRSHSPRSGFTLVELLVASFITTLLLASCMALLAQHQSIHLATRQMTEIRQNVGFAMDSVLRDVRMAGYGLDVPDSELDTWVSWISTFTVNSQISDGANGDPDGLVLVAAFDNPVARLVTGVTTGETLLAVEMLDPTPNLLNTYNRSILYLNKTETLRITGITGTGTNLYLSISAHPTDTTGVHNEYFAGSTLELVKAVTYVWHDADEINGVAFPCLVREDDDGVYTGLGTWEVSAAYYGAVWGDNADLQPNGDIFIDLSLLEKMLSNRISVVSWKEIRH
jgi:prepilin-type N-terminal cleavage/methylation domain-containing protein